MCKKERSSSQEDKPKIPFEEFFNDLNEDQKSTNKAQTIQWILVNVENVDCSGRELASISFGGYVKEPAEEGDTKLIVVKDTSFDQANLVGSFFDSRFAEFKNCSFSHAKGGTFVSNCARVFLCQSKLDHLENSKIESALGSIENCDFRFSDLQYSKFKETKLFFCDFRGANLFGCRFTDGGEKDSRLLSVNFFASNLGQAVLPESFDNFKGNLDSLAETTRSLRSIHNLLMSLCFTSLCLVLFSSAKVKVVLLENSVSLHSWLVMCSTGLLLLQTYFFHSQDRLWHLILNLPIRFPDGLRLRHKIFPWISTSCVEDLIIDLNPGIKGTSLADCDESFKGVSSLNIFVSQLIGWFCVPLTVSLSGWIYLSWHKLQPCDFVLKPFSKTLFWSVLLLSLCISLGHYVHRANSIRFTPWQDRVIWSKTALCLYGNLILVLFTAPVVASLVKTAGMN